MKKHLIIHPSDPSTTFLKRIYQNIPDKTVIKGGVNKVELLEYIKTHDRLIFCGHGSPLGLLSVGKFPDSYPYVVDDSIAKYLKNKPNNLFIWCHASEFVNRNRLYGISCQMFISQVNEGLWYDFPYTDSLEDIINESNCVFASIISKFINQPIVILFQNLLREYGDLAKSNPIAEFNFQRIFLRQPKDSIHKEICNTRLR